MTKSDKDRLTEYLLAPVSEQELLAYVYLLVRIFATERSKYWDQPSPSTGPNIWTAGNGAWLLQITYGEAHAVYSWWNIDLHSEPEYKLFMFREDNRVARAIVTARSEDKYSRAWWRAIHGDFTTRSAFMCNLANRDMQNDPLKTVTALHVNRPKHRTLDRLEFADEFGIILPNSMTAEARRIVGV